MERFTLAPTSREIMVNRASDTADDLFSYRPETKTQARTLGYLYVVGHTDQESDTVGYLVSLVAAMAKREYYSSQPGVGAKESFARTLRKVNEVVEEFFKTNEVGVNVGIFAVAGDTVYVSRLGKFRIILARDEKIIDVLKDVSRFTKEVVQKKRFSSIISGPVQAQDRLVAYFPKLALTRRESVIKANAGSDSAQEFEDRLSELGKNSSSFNCSLLVIDIDQVPSEPETQMMPEPDPQAVPRLAWSPRQGRGTAAGHHTSATDTAQEGASVGSAPGPDEVPVQYRDGQDNSSSPQEAPHIIPAEFSHRRRGNTLSRSVDSVRKIRLGSRGKAFFLGIAVIVVVAGVLGLKSTLFTSEADQQLHASLDAASAGLADVLARIEDGDGIGARALILDQLPNLLTMAVEHQSPDARDLYASFIDALNSIDRAQPASVTLLGTIDASEGEVMMGAVASGSDALWVLARAPGQNGQVLLKVINGEVSESVALESSADILIPAPPSVLLADESERTVTVFEAPSGATVLPTPDRILAVDWFIDYAYVLTTTGIMKVEDLDTKKPVAKQWLSDVSELSPGAKRIAVDGDVWVLSSDGTLSKFFRGGKVSDFRLPFAVTDAHDLLTDEDMPFLYVTDTRLKRVHVIDKESAQLLQTVTVETEQEVKDFMMLPDYSLVMLASDGKIWKVE